jgi:hypothetical protein
MAITRLGPNQSVNLASNVTGTLATGNGGTGSTAATLPASLINNTSIGNITALPSGVGGKLLKYANDFDTAQINLSTNSYVDTNLSIAFTPTASDSTLVVKAMVQVYASGNHGSYHGSMNYKILKDSSTFGEAFNVYSGYGGLQALINGPFGYTYSETSGSTSSRTYKVQVQNPETPTGSTYNQYGGYSTLEVYEIGA